jgi:hypothetical protein
MGEHLGTSELLTELLTERRAAVESTRVGSSPNDSCLQGVP